jgi:glycosyltransferase involved in cell wall biosynthesis
VEATVTGMKKVLIITYYWPPSGGAGVQRWLKFVKYLREFGWEPIVYTAENPEVPVIDESLDKDIPEGIQVLRTKVWEPYHIYKKITGRKSSEKIQTAFLSEKKKPGLAENISIWIRGNLFIPDARRYWIKPSVNFLSEWLKNNPVDMIVSTGPPHSMHLIALKLKNLTGIPWLADFRDPWTNIDFYNQLKLSYFADRRHKYLEKKVLQTADAVTVISNGMAEDFRTIVPREYRVVTNGFDEDDFKDIIDQPAHDKFRMAHVGSLVKTRNPLVLWKAISELLREHPEISEQIEIALTGNVDISVRETVREFGLEHIVIYQNYIPHAELYKEYNKTSALLLLINDTPNANLILTGKLFEYLGAKRPIICIGPKEGDSAAILNETKTGRCFDPNSKQALKEYIKHLISHQSDIKRTLSVANNKPYIRRNLTAGIVELINSSIKLKVSSNN